jgi:CRISPR-associated protein Cas1
MEDINSIVIENLATSCSIYSLQKLTENNVAVFLCDEKHMPSSLILSFNNYSRQLKVFNAQLTIKKPIIKQLWQTIIIRKIENQAECLKLLGNNNYDYLLNLAKNVLSDDSTNVEAVAAHYYFKELFGKTFNRINDNIINSALNYGYAILRGLIARTSVAYGFETFLGIHHKTQLNSFNLADDVIEPFRPIVDLFVAQYFVDKKEDDLSTELKKQLYNIVNYDLLSDNEIHSTSYAIERFIMSLQRCFLDSKIELILPKLLPLKIHEYE